MVVHSHLAEPKIRPSDFSAPMPDERSRSTQFAWALLLFASGFSALVFQVIWVKQLSLIVGVDVYAVDRRHFGLHGRNGRRRPGVRPDC
jgi:spermidine synthase